VLLNGKKITSEKGKDILDNGINVNKHTLYEVITLTEPGTGILQIISSAPGLEVYTFTFG